MAWQGVPFLHEGLSFLNSGVLTVNRIPLISVDTGFGWDTFASTILAGLITGGISWYAIRTNNKILKDERERQEKLAQTQLKAQYISVNRQQWINELRDTVAMYIAGIVKHWNLHGQGHDLFKQKGTLSCVEVDDLMKQVNDLHGETSFLVAKISLLLNPYEEECAEIIEIQSDIVGYLNDIDFTKPINMPMLNKRLVDVTELTQKICKAEWERIKLLK